MLILHPELLSYLHQPPKTVDVIRVLSVYVLIDLEGLIEEVHSAVAGGDHELPFDLPRLDLEGPLEVHDRLLELVLLRVMHTQTRDHIDLRWVVPIRLLVVVNSLELVLLLLI